MAPIDLALLAAFLADAHRNTYADKDAAKAPSTRQRSFDYRFERGDLLYHDTYFGMRDYIGEEVVYRHQAPVWGMNYYGIVVSAYLIASEVYDFLREALKQDCSGITPARGPALHRRDGWAYTNAVEGTLDDFGGTESIHRNGELAYRCRYHGGWIS